MSIYSETMSNTPNLDMSDFVEIKEPELQEDPFQLCHQNWLVNTVLKDKGYGVTNIIFENGNWVLEMSETVVKRFVQNMGKLGYTCTVSQIPETKLRTFRKYRLVKIEDHHPFDLLHVYHYLDVVK